MVGAAEAAPDLCAARARAFSLIGGKAGSPGGIWIKEVMVIFSVGVYAGAAGTRRICKRRQSWEVTPPPSPFTNPGVLR